ADVLCAAAKRRNADHRVGRRASRDLYSRPHGVVQGASTSLVDQVHGALRETVALQESLALMAEHVDQRIADADDVELVRAHCSGVREPGLRRGWPDLGATRLRPSGKYFPISRSRRRRVAWGNADGFVITALSSSRGHSHSRVPPIVGMTVRSTCFAVATFLRRFATTASTLTAACVSCQTS